MKRRQSNISIHALLAESDTWARGSRGTYVEFLSTLSLRRATVVRRNALHELNISIHALLAESDQENINSRTNHIISIHALLAESDPEKSIQCYPDLHFYPRSPCGERLAKYRRIPLLCNAFLSTLSLRRATHAPNRRPYRCSISIHALLAESDNVLSQPSKPRRLFLSTLSLRRATFNG